MNIYIGNLPSEVTGNDLREVFEWYGRVEAADVVKHRPGERSRGSGFVDMPSRIEGVFAVLGVHGRNMDGQVVTATEVRPRDPVSGVCRTCCPCRSGK